MATSTSSFDFKRPYGVTTFPEKLGFAFTFLKLPILYVWLLARSWFSKDLRWKSIRRLISDYTFHLLTSSLNIPQIQALNPPTDQTFKSYIKSKDVEGSEQDVGEDAKLLWLGRKRSGPKDRVILYLHGGAYFFGMSAGALPMWIHIQRTLRTKNIDCGVAILKYTVGPEQMFPNQLRQAVLAVNHLLSSGIPPSHITLAGDSAGGNLILALLSHALHPIPNVPTLNLSSPLAGAYLMSPWVSLGAMTGSVRENSPHDMFPGDSLLYWGNTYLTPVSKTQLPYVVFSPQCIQSLAVDVDPSPWWDEIEGVCNRVLITAGELECLRDDIIEFSEILESKHRRVRHITQVKGIHNDPIVDFGLSDSNGNENSLLPIIVQWFTEAYSS